MNDIEALNEYLNSKFIGRDDAGVDHTREIEPTRAWEAACVYKDKRITELEDVLKMIRDHIDGGLESEDIHKWIDDVLEGSADAG